MFVVFICVFFCKNALQQIEKATMFKFAEIYREKATPST